MNKITNIFKNIPELEMDDAKKKVLLVYIAVLIVIFAVYALFFLSPSLKKLFELIPKVRILNSEIKAVNDDSRFESKLKDKLDALNIIMGQYENKLSREKELPKLLENLSNIANSSRVKIVGITPLESSLSVEDSKNIYQEVPIAVTAQSSYHDLGIFIDKLETDERHMRVSNIKIRAGKTNPKRHDIEFTVYAYTFKGES